MANNIYNTFINVIENLKKDNNTKSIILVGSCAKKNLETDCNINDIDIFIIVENQEKDQIREIKLINDIEFDMNFISIKGSENFIKDKTYFFLKLFEGKLLYDVNNIGKDIMNLCKVKYEEGPNKLSNKEKILQKEQLLSDISRLAYRGEFDDFEYCFLINIYLSKVIKLFYIINDKWLPKDKKLLKSLKEDDYTMYKLVCNVIGDNTYENLMDVVKYSLKNK